MVRFKIARLVSALQKLIKHFFLHFDCFYLNQDSQPILYRAIEAISFERVIIVPDEKSSLPEVITSRFNAVSDENIRSSPLP